MTYKTLRQARHNQKFLLQEHVRKELCHGGPNQRKIIELNQKLTFFLLDVLYLDTDY